MLKDVQMNILTRLLLPVQDYNLFFNYQFRL